jgi:ATP-binding cassette subfamily B (MDR/TAP) protein 1
MRSAIPLINGSKGQMLPKVWSGDAIQFRNVSFHYPTRSQVQVLKIFNLQVMQGQNIAIFSPSGSGKSTIIALLERFYDVASGEILISGKPLPELDTNAYRAAVSLVSQGTCLYQGTIREKILLGISSNAPVSQKVLIKACRDANIYEFIVSLPEGLKRSVAIKVLLSAVDNGSALPKQEP